MGKALYETLRLRLLVARRESPGHMKEQHNSYGALRAAGSCCRHMLIADRSPPRAL